MIRRLVTAMAVAGLAFLGASSAAHADGYQVSSDIDFAEGSTGWQVVGSDGQAGWSLVGSDGQAGWQPL
ncbi:hypothetical protein OHA98_20640 [Streptomyces sp. NBC_00654]|uniref:hypothetical protein n=1 Tax=Streptomyces sp. NBC_00654 TaxID=2975799 RepID=UPI00225A771D|nr:hypothetical protein [Streptomyces sp. NBC_00654]MCX4967150.1 hypothetical protein [Streptomyces sp. NBC_00654]